MDIPEWVSRARPIEKPILEVGFVVNQDFYFGPENDFSMEQWKSLREPVHQPALDLHDFSVGYVLTPVLESGVGEMVKHYADLFRVGERHGKPVDPYYFWLTPFLFSPGELQIQFCWHDTREDSERLLAALETASDGAIYDDYEEHWRLTVFASGDRLYIRHADPGGDPDDWDAEVEVECISCDRAALVRQVAPLRARLDRILAELQAALGGDYWSRRPIDEDDPAWQEALFG